MNMIHEFWGVPTLQRLPSEYLKDRNYWGFLYDPIAVRRSDCIGTDKLLWATDFAHAASEWPHSRKYSEEDFAGVPEDEKYMMLAGNMIHYFHLDG